VIWPVTARQVIFSPSFRGAQCANPEFISTQHYCGAMDFGPAPSAQNSFAILTRRRIYDVQLHIGE
jgi:hypothetical protein